MASTAATRLARELVRQRIQDRARGHADRLRRSAAQSMRGELDLISWCYQYRRHVRPGRLFDLDRYFYMREIYESDRSLLVLRKAAQLGYSEYLISYALWCCDVRNADVMLVAPSGGHVSDFSSARIGPAIEASQHLTRITRSHHDRKVRGADRVTLKRINDAFFYLRAATVRPDGKAIGLKSVPADILLLDEIDEMDPRAPAIARKRLGDSEIAEERWGSTPTYPGVGIDAEYLRTDQRRWLMPCPHCGHRHALEIDHLVTEWDDLQRPVAWHQRDGVPFMACPRCSQPMDRGAQGEWVATYPERDAAGYHMDKLMLARHPLQDILTNLGKPREQDRKEAWNQDLGLPFKPTGSGLDRALLMECMRDGLPYGRRIDRSRACFMGIDVGSVDLYVIVREGPGAESKDRPLLFAGNVGGFDEAARLVALFDPVTVVCDAMPETREARRFQAEQRKGLVWLAYYHGGTTGRMQEEPVAWDRGEGRVVADRTRTLDDTVSRFMEQANTLPPNAPDLPDYFNHLLAITRVVETNRRGDLLARYVETGADHFAHAENYCTIASLRPVSLGVFV